FMPIINLGSKPQEADVLGFLKDIWGIEDTTIAERAKAVKDVTNRNALHKDIAKIVLFFADKPMVKKHLKPLNAAIVAKLQNETNKSVQQKQKQTSLLAELATAVLSGNAVNVAKTD